ncbi:MAG: NAD(P)/FAD-dependent oxidoreductase [Deltaproteobacteria bacterium]|nr:NAD(P)/FAD-dependent oxidoreductase [Deltaproteobacteria bacterium]MBW2143482.1 NAD(P)/FAD-dependent oxidoreductase [Deltaproteobacteria bacterium]
MKTNTHEVVIIGGGHNGLTVAGYLAKAGVDVCVLEALPFVGGGVVSVESAAPGFKTDPCSVWHGLIQANPLILNDELGLKSKFGLKYIRPENQYGVLFPDDSYLILYRDIDKTCESIAKFSEHDAQAYRKFYDWSEKLLDMLTQGMFNPPASFGAMVSLLDQSPEGRDLLRCMLISAAEICDDWFETPELKATLTKFVAEELVSPRAKGTGFVVFVLIPLMHRYGGALPEGGSGALSEAMVRCIQHYGGTIRTNAPVEKVMVTSGEARGVILKGGEQVMSTRAVISNLNAKQIPALIGKENTPESYAKDLKKLRLSSHRSICQGYALHEPPNFTAGQEVNESFFVEFATKPYDKFLRRFDDMEYGYMSVDMPVISCQTRFDPTRAPQGKHALYLFHYTPYDLAEGGAHKWDEKREEIADAILGTLRKQTTNMGSDNIIGRMIETPLDLERRNPAMIGGDYSHLGMHLSQLMGNRYLPGWSYKTPVEKFWMCGPSCHPGVGVNGGGRAAVQPVMEELGIDFESVIGR